MRSPIRHRPALLLTTAALLAALSGCGSGSGAGTEPPAAAGESAPLFSALPEEYQQSGEVVVGADIAYAPMEYYDTDGTTVLGLDKDLSDALSEQLGVAFVWKNATFDGLITQLRSGRIDIVMSGMSDTPERQQEVDFVDYYRAGAMLLVAKGNPAGLTSIADLCGRTVAVQRGTTQEGYAQDQSTLCEAEGSEPIELLTFDRETEAMLQIKSGRADAGLQDYPVASYNARTSGGGEDFEVVGEQIEAGPLGIAVGKEDTELRDAIQQALQALIDDGTYAGLLEKYEVPLGAVDEATVNGG